MPVLGTMEFFFSVSNKIYSGLKSTSFLNASYSVLANLIIWFVLEPSLTFNFVFLECIGSVLKFGLCLCSIAIYVSINLTPKNFMHKPNMRKSVICFIQFELLIVLLNKRTICCILTFLITFYVNSKINFICILRSFFLFFPFFFKDFSDTDDILRCLKSGKITKSYSPNFRSFAFTLNFYSPRAYNYLRSVFGDHLPAPSTIRSWYSSIDGSPGLSSDALNALKTKASDANSKGNTLFAAIIFDEMSLHRSYQWDNNKHKMSGFEDFGNVIQKEQNNEMLLAKEALVFMINGINEKFKIPVGYFLINKLKHKEKAAIVKEILLAVSKTGIKVIAMIFDGLKGNYTMCIHLGANFELDMPFIVNPHSCDKVFLFWDAAHMEKLARNRLAKLKILYNERNEKIEWQYFVALEEFQRNLGCQLGNKLTRYHIQWFRKKMNVRMAVETLSLSVANAMEYLCELGYAEFQGSGPTVEYIRYMNNIFDILNSKKSDAVGYKRPLCKATKDEYFSYFEKAIQFISGLKLEPNGKSILKTDSKTAFFGFIQNMKNMKNIYNEYIESDVMESLFTFSLSQDHLELLFGRIRSMHGFNDNPTVEQFAAAYRRLQVHNDVTASNYANCSETYESILTVSSRRPKLAKSNQTLMINNNNGISEDDEDLVSIGTLANDEVAHAIKLNVIAYLASFIEKEIIESRGRRLAVTCMDCIRAFGDDDFIEDAFLERKSEEEDILIPCKSTVDICTAAETVLQRQGYNIKQYDRTIEQILACIDLEKVFASSEFEHHDQDHKKLFVSTIVKIYVRKKMNFLSREKTRDVVGDQTRNQSKKIQHFKGQ